MSEWPPTAAKPVDDAWSVDDLEIGDLLFCAKSTGPLAELGRLADEPWRHVAIVDRDPDGDWAVLEAGNHFGWRKLGAFLRPILDPEPDGAPAPAATRRA